MPEFPELVGQTMNVESSWTSCQTAAIPCALLWSTLALDSHDNLYVADTMKFRIQKFATVALDDSKNKTHASW